MNFFSSKSASVLCAALLVIPLLGRPAVASADEASSADRDALQKAVERLAKLPRQDPGTKKIVSAAEKNPTERIGCSIDQPQPVYTSYAVCLSVLSIAEEGGLKREAGTSLLKSCAGMAAYRCYAMIDELQDLSKNAGVKDKTALIEQCAEHTKQKFPGEDKPHYLQACKALLDYLK